MKSSFLRITSDLFPAIEKMHHIQSDGAGPLSFQLLFEENRKVFNKIMYDNVLRLEGVYVVMLFLTYYS